jgi:hypothetical protein
LTNESVVGSTIAYANGQAIGSGGGGSSNISGNIVVDYLYVNPANTIKLDTTEARFNVTIQANTLINANSVTVNTANIVLLRNHAQFNVAMNVADWFAVNANSIALNTTEARFNVPVVIGSTILYANGASVGGAGGGNGVSLLSQLNDVNISSPSDGQVLTYDSLTSKWRNENATGGSGSGYPPQLGYAGI